MHILAPLSLPLSIYPSLSLARALSLHMLVPEQSQNRELKMLLNQYLTSKVNGQLYVPPTATISRVEG